MALKKGTAVATIDVVMATIKTATKEICIVTASEIGVEPQIETTDAVKLIVKGKLYSQKPAVNTITGHTIKLKDNVFIPEAVLIFQGGEIIYDATDPTLIIGYNPPVAGSSDSGEIFEFNTYSAVYTTAGIISKYEKVSYPNCKGSPVGLGLKDGEFRSTEYPLTSAPDDGQPPYSLTYVTTLPVVT